MSRLIELSIVAGDYYQATFVHPSRAPITIEITAADWDLPMTDLVQPAGGYTIYSRGKGPRLSSSSGTFEPSTFLELDDRVIGFDSAGVEWEADKAEYTVERRNITDLHITPDPDDRDGNIVQVRDGNVTRT